MTEIQGIIPPITTPFDADGEIDEALLRADVRHLVEAVGVHGLAVGGSTGEGHTLSVDELRLAGGRVPVIAGIIADSTRQVIERGRALADLDVAALQITPVHYLFRPDDRAMYRYFATVAEALERPVIVYNVVPWAYCSPQLLTRLITEVELVIGVKQSAGDLALLADLLLELGDGGVVLSAVDALLYPSFCLGAHGAIAAILTAVPQLCLQLWAAVRAGDHARALVHHRSLLRIWRALEGDNLPATVKCAMESQGRPAGLPRAPMPPSTDAQRGNIRVALQGAGLLPSA